MRTLLLLVALCSSNGHAAEYKKGVSLTVVLQDGKEISGVFQKKADGNLVLEVDQGEVEVDTALISSTRVEKSLTEKYREKRKKLSDTDLHGHLALAKWARKEGLGASAEAEAAFVLERDPRNTEAHFFLGHIQVNDEWLTEEQAKDAGLKEDNGYWYMPRARPTEARPGHGSRVTDAAIRKLALKPGNVVTVEYGPMSYASGEYHGRDARGLIRIETQRGDVFIDPGHVRTIRRATPLQAEYLTMKAATSSSDPEGLWALCLWADAHGMRAEALEAAKYYLVERPDDLDAARYIQTGGKSLSAPLPGGKPPSAN